MATDFSNSVRIALVKRGWKLKQLVDALNAAYGTTYAENYISHWLSGAQRSKRLTERIASVLELEVI